MTVKTTNVSIPFSNGSTTDNIPEISLELDEDKHLELYGDSNKSDFYPGERCYFRVLFSGDYNATYGSTLGTVSHGTGTGLKTITDTITFQGESTASLSYLPASVVSYSWLGHVMVEQTGGTFTLVDTIAPLFNDKDITISKNVIGLLICVYAAEYKRCSLLVSANDMGAYTSLPVVVYALLRHGSGFGAIRSPEEEQDYWRPVNKAFYDVTYYLSADSAETTIQVLDYATGSAISGAAISLNGSSVGSTDSSGRLVSWIQPGVQYTIGASAEGYETNTDDILNNELFIIPIAS
jgi:hypothetical protein